SINFIRLSPQSSHKILLGKLLGVPILIYLAGAIFLPLHLWANISSGLSLSWLFGFYGVLIAVCYFLYNASLLLAFLGVTQAWLIATITGIFLFPIMGIIESYTNETNALIDTDGIRYLLIVAAIIILGLILGSYWIWKAVNRRYRNPNATIISKEQSYWLMGCFHFYLLPLFLLINIGNDEKSSYILWNSLIFFCTINLFWFLLVIALLSPQRKSVQDWARYRHQQINNDETAIVKGLAISLKQDLIWGEKSPALVAIGINLVITGLIWSSWILLWHDNEIKLRAILTLILSLNLILIYAAIVQFVLLMKVKKPAIWAVGILDSLISLPPIALLLLSISPNNHSNLWLFSTFPWLSIDLNYPAIASMLIAIIGQWSVLTLVTL
ncbi:MAG: hypothetical protein F6K35_29090, partial [Okeania sp. SIO2H7]|nr:hypothetical protein [Okeania sp. SIO2H7]